MLRRRLTTILGSPGSLQWWKGQPQGFFSPEFVVLAEEILEWQQEREGGARVEFGGTV